MNRQLTMKEVDELFSSVIDKPMTRKEKLLHWAKLVRNTHTQFIIFHELEYVPYDMLNGLHHPHSAFAVAAADPTLQQAGLKSDYIGEAMRFFELTRTQLHAFSCDCGGAISNRDMADRIERL